jgi:hypothetical protein
MLSGEKGREGDEVGFLFHFQVVVGEGGLVSGLLLCGSYFTIR